MTAANHSQVLSVLVITSLNNHPVVMVRVVVIESTSLMEKMTSNQRLHLVKEKEQPLKTCMLF